MAEGTARSLEAPAWREAGERGLAPAEMPGGQALEHPYPPSPLGPGRVARRACAYSRRGTVTWRAHFAVAQGTIVPPSLGPTRTADDFGAPITRTVASAPEATRWHFVTAPLHRHPAESWGRFVAAPDGLGDDRGAKETRGLLQSMATRAAWLSAPTQRLVCHAPPQHAAWRNQRERWCSLWARKLLTRASVTSVAALPARRWAFIAYFNATRAKPCKGTYGRNPLSV
jgi:DDE superfamily endonuclease